MVVLHFKGKLTTQNLSVTAEPGKSTLMEHAQNSVPQQACVGSQKESDTILN